MYPEELAARALGLPDQSHLLTVCGRRRREPSDLNSAHGRAAQRNDIERFELDDQAAEEGAEAQRRSRSRRPAALQGRVPPRERAARKSAGWARRTLGALPCRRAARESRTCSENGRFPSPRRAPSGGTHARPKSRSTSTTPSTRSVASGRRAEPELEDAHPLLVEVDQRSDRQIDRGHDCRSGRGVPEERDRPDAETAEEDRGVIRVTEPDVGHDTGRRDARKGRPAEV